MIPASGRAVHRSFQDVNRASPEKLAKMLLADGALVPLTGARCSAEKCVKFVGKTQ